MPSEVLGPEEFKTREDVSVFNILCAITFVTQGSKFDIKDGCSHKPRLDFIFSTNSNRNGFIVTEYVEYQYNLIDSAAASDYSYFSQLQGKLTFFSFLTKNVQIRNSIFYSFMNILARRI